MTDNEIIKALECCGGSNCHECPIEGCTDDIFGNALDLINRQKDKIKEFDKKLIIQQGLIDYQKAEIERLNKNYEELIYKTDCLLCHATGNKFSKYTYTTQEMISFVDDYIQDCCDEAVEEAKEAVKSEAIKEFAEELEYFVLNEDIEVVEPKCKDYESYINGANQFRHQIKNGINNLVKKDGINERFHPKK